MKNVVYFDPKTFIPESIEFSDNQYNLARTIREFLCESFDPDAYPSPLIADKEGKKIIFGLMKKRYNDETIGEKYKITVEKISDAEMNKL